MEDQHNKPRGGLSSAGTTASVVHPERPEQTDPVDRAPGYGREEAANGHPSARHAHPFHGRDETRPRQHEAHAAFSANSEITATTPRRTAWMQGHTLDGPFGHERRSICAPQQDIGRSVTPRADIHQQGGWQPSLVVGSIDVNRLGARESARRHMLQWEKIFEFNNTHNPGSAETVKKRMVEAKRVYGELCASELEEDILPKNQLPAYQNDRIQARTALLWKTIYEAPNECCQPMKVNITAAVDAYNTGSIGFSDHYTLIYAGHVVDTTCKTYNEFMVDRRERLDRYFEQYGPGYASIPLFYVREFCFAPSALRECPREPHLGRIANLVIICVISSGSNRHSRQARTAFLLKDARLLISKERTGSTQESNTRTIPVTIKYLWVSRKTTV